VEVNVSGKHDLNEAFNKMIRRAKGELIVFYQDFIKIPPDGLRKFWEEYQQDKNTLFTAPVGKVKSFADETPAWDWRDHTDECDWTRCELDWGAIPKKILLEIGGFDERLDQWWSFDNVSVGKRAFLKGYKFKNVRYNPAIALDHDAIIEHPFRPKYNPQEVNKILNEYESNPTLDYVI